MMFNEAAFRALLAIDLWEVAKIFVLIGLGVYLIFAFIVVRQVKLMTEVVSGILTLFLRFVSWLFFLFAAGVFILTLMYL